ncbi:hypothetical protein D3Z53_22865 [Lachnospiraceae bacterium]|jgi:hypothetical protein|nr:hypothetical protein [uncultured Schaedlerella sp.]MCI9153925.1 hypothetical protein [Ruminococcus sp.]NBI60810.1 hypothetical protein [Lachnospiraceae bacterium]
MIEQNLFKLGELSASIKSSVLHQIKKMKMVIRHIGNGILQQKICGEHSAGNEENNRKDGLVLLNITIPLWNHGEHLKKSKSFKE